MELKSPLNASATRDCTSCNPHASTSSCRWPSSATFKSKGFESAVQMVGVLPILVVTYLCHMSLGHTVRGCL